MPNNYTEALGVLFILFTLFIYLFVYSFIYLLTTLFNVGQTIIKRPILAKNNTDIINKNFKILDMQHKNTELFVYG